ncbi:flagellar hook protein FlgE [soil metagenome]
MSFYTSLSGLKASQSEMATISHNLANVSTTGFKKSRTEFSDVIASSLAADPTKMVGSGVVVKANTQQFSEGTLTTTSSSLDLAIAGDGFFAVKTAGTNSAVNYTRNGGFIVDADRNIVDAQGSYLQAFPVDSNGNVTAAGSAGLTNVQIPETSGTPIATSTVSLGVKLSSNATVPTAAFDRTNASSYNNATTTTIYDSSGSAHTMTNYYVRDTAAAGTPPTSQWSVYSFVGDTQLKISGAATPVTATFDAAGVMTAPTAATTFDAISPGGVAQTLKLDLAGTDQAGTTFSVASRSQDGETVGQLSGVTVDDAGVISASYSNGNSLKLGKVALANFANPTGLRQMGNSYWSSTGISGTAKVGTASENGFGSLMSGTVEGSNVDLTEELVALIAAQRNFQANAKALDTAGQISQTIFNMRS